MAKPQRYQRPKRTDGFREMIEKDQPGAKEETAAVIAAFVANYDGSNAAEVAEDILHWLHVGDELEG